MLASNPEPATQTGANPATGTARQVGIIFGGCFGRVVAELLAGAGLIDAGAPGIVGMYALMGAGE
jgi:hypothetical protein